MARDNFLDDGLVKNRKCACYRVGEPQPGCGRLRYCTCAPDLGLQAGKLPVQIIKAAFCTRHDLDLPAASGGPSVPARVETLEAADPIRAAALRRLGLRRSSPWYLERLSEGA